MGHEIDLVSTVTGRPVIGERGVVERFLVSEGLPAPQSNQGNSSAARDDR